MALLEALGVLQSLRELRVFWSRNLASATTGSAGACRKRSTPEKIISEWRVTSPARPLARGEWNGSTGSISPHQTVVRPCREHNFLCQKSLRHALRSRQHHGKLHGSERRTTPHALRLQNSCYGNLEPVSELGTKLH